MRAAASSAIQPPPKRPRATGLAYRCPGMGHVRDVRGSRRRRAGLLASDEPVRLAGHQQLGDQPGPAGLMRRADTPSAVAMEVFVEQQIVAEVRIRLELRGFAKDRASPLGVLSE